MDLNFLTTNPALDQFQKSQKIARDEEAQGIKNKYLTANTEATQQGTEQAKAEGPTRLRLLGSQADTSAANATTALVQAKYAPQEMQAKIGEMVSQITARQAATAMNAYNMQYSYAVQGNIPAAKSVARALGINGIPIAFQSGLVNSCAFNSSFPCSRAEFGNGNLTFTIENNMSNSVKLNSLGCYATNVIVQNNAQLGKVLAPGGTYNVTAPCYNYLGRIAGVALNLNLGLALNYSVANATRTVPGKAYILIGSA